MTMINGTDCTMCCGIGMFTGPMSVFYRTISCIYSHLYTATLEDEKKILI